MKFRVGHEVRYEIVLEAPSAQEAERMAAQVPYDQWHHLYLTIEDCLPLDESPVNPQAE